MLIGEIISRRAAISPDFTYWRQGDQRLTYEWFGRQSNRVAHGLLREAGGPPPRDWMAGVFCGNHPAYPAVFFGAAKAGVVLVHLNDRYGPRSLAQTVAHAGCRVGFVDMARLKVVEEALADRETRQSIQVQTWVVVDPPVGEALPGWAVAWEDWLSGNSGEEPPPLENTRETDPFQLLYTSGTSGEPRGVLISHASKIRLATTHALNIGLNADSRVVSALPLCHHFAQWLNMVALPLVGGMLVSLPHFDPQAIWYVMSRHGITHLPGVPTMLRRLLDVPGSERGAANDLEQIVYGGEPADELLVNRLKARFPGVRLFQGLGQTETGYYLGLHTPDHNLSPRSVGRPDVFSEVRLVDEAGKNVPDGQVGEIIARTPYMMNGYYKDDAATADYHRFGALWGATGDMAWKDPKGYYYLAGRKSDLIISGGINIHPVEVEKTLLAHDQVVDAAVVGMPDTQWGEAVWAAVVLRSPNGLSQPQGGSHPGLEKELLDFCHTRLEGYKIPRRITFLARLPRNAGGKVVRLDVKAILSGERPPPGAEGVKA
ncbi:MAG: acyl--CoA ligase [Deltaproteobacteria bacterium]|nr:acyl--CoA ligase [Deltaproteobacteria bacterium]